MIVGKKWQVYLWLERKAIYTSTWSKLRKNMLQKVEVTKLTFFENIIEDRSWWYDILTVTNFLEHYEIIHRHFYHQILSIFIRIPQAFTQQVQWTFFVIRHSKYVSVFPFSKKACRPFSMLMSAPPLKRWFIHFSSKNLVVLTSTIQAVATWRMSQRNFYIKVASCQGCCVAKCVVFAARFSDVTFGEEGRSKHHPPNLCRVLNAARGCIFREGLFLRKLIRSTQKELHFEDDLKAALCKTYLEFPLSLFSCFWQMMLQYSSYY